MKKILYQISCQTPQSNAEGGLEKILLILTSYIAMVHTASLAVQLYQKEIEKK